MAAVNVSSCMKPMKPMTPMTCTQPNGFHPSHHVTLMACIRSTPGSPKKVQLTAGTGSRRTGEHYSSRHGGLQAGARCSSRTRSRQSLQCQENSALCWWSFSSVGSLQAPCLGLRQTCNCSCVRTLLSRHRAARQEQRPADGPSCQNTAWVRKDIQQSADAG